jgi:tetratricopeptide (TPR) repeat protein
MHKMSSLEIEELTSEESLGERKRPEDRIDRDRDDLLGKFPDGMGKELADENHEAHFKLGITLLKMGLLDEAIEEFSIASGERQRMIPSLLKISACLVQRGDYQAALTELEKGLNREALTESETKDIRQEIAKVCELSGDEERANRERQKILELDDRTEKNDDDHDNLYEAPRTGLFTWLLYLIVVAVLAAGWQIRDDGYLGPDSGLGFNLGIAGSVIMLLLLLYPVRKKAGFMQNWGAIKYWFQTHMVLGIIGPTLILFHCNFHMGSLNSQVVLWSTLVVAISGLVGIFFYSKIHYGLYGRQASLLELQKDVEINRNSLGFLFGYAPKLQRRLLNFEADVLSPSHSFLHSVWRLLTIRLRTVWTHLVLLSGLRRALKVTARRLGWTPKERRKQGKDARYLISIHMNTVLKITLFSFYERLFALWRVFHMPLFFLLVITGLVHVIAVHMY